MIRIPKFLCVLLTFALTVAVSAAAEKDEPSIQKDQLGSTPNVTRFGKTLFGGQPDKAALKEAKQQGVEVVLTFRETKEIDWDDAEAAEMLGLEFHRFSFRAPESLNDELLDGIREVLNESRDKPRMLYCGSANRVGAIWTAHRALDGELSVEDALKEGKRIGLRSEGYVAVVKDYIQRKKKEQ